MSTDGTVEIPRPIAVVAPGVWRLVLPLPGAATINVNAYLLADRGGFTIIDCGWAGPATRAALDAGLAGIGATVRDITTIIATHAHIDHYGSAGELRRGGATEVAMHEDDIRFAAYWFGTPVRYADAISQWTARHGAPPAEAASAGADAVSLAHHATLAPDHRPLRGGERMACDAGDLEVIHTPGHTGGHVVLFQRETGLLFSGDHVLPSVVPNVSLLQHSPPDPLGRYLESLEAMRKLPVRQVLPGHGSPIDDLGARLDVLVAACEARTTEVANALGSEPRTAYEIASGAKWIGSRLTWTELGPRRRRQALLATLARLALLEARSRARQLERGGTVRYLAD
jgi:glyoxylase-like metal-dependent hydrolase (beta-lactamase superfamily II)